MNVNEYLIEMITDALEELYAPQDVIDNAEDYLEGDMDEEEFLKRLPKIDFSKNNNIVKTSKALAEIRNYNNDKYLKKYINILYEIGRESIDKIFRRVIYRPLNEENVQRLIKIGIDKYKVYSIYLNGNAFNMDNLYNSVIKEIENLCKNDVEEAKRIMENLKSNDDIFDNALTVIAVIYCSTRNLDELEKCSEEKEYYQNMLEYMENSLLSSIDNMYSNKLAEVLVDKTKNFLKGNKGLSTKEGKTLIEHFKNYTPSYYLFNFLMGFSYMIYKRSKIFKRFLKFFARVSPDYALTAIYNILPNRFVYDEENEKQENYSASKGLDKELNIEEKEFILWFNEKFYVFRGLGKEILEERLKKNKVAFEEAAFLSKNNYSKNLLLTFLNGEDREKYVEIIKNNYIEEYSKNQKFTSEQINIIKMFLKGEKSFDECKETFNEIEANSNYEISRSRIIEGRDIRLLKENNITDLYDRFILLFGAISYKNIGYTVMYYSNNTKYNLEWREEFLNYAFNLFEENNFPIKKRIDCIQFMYSSYGFEELKKNVLSSIIEKIIDKHKDEFVEEIRNISASGRCKFLEELFRNKSEENANILISYFEDSSKSVRAKVISLLEKEINMYPLVRKKLFSKKQMERTVAINILEKYKNSYKCSEDIKQSINDDLNKTLENERNPKIKDLLMKILGLKNEILETEEEFINRVLNKNKNRRSSLSWLETEYLCKVRLKNSEEYCKDDIMLALLLCYSLQGKIAINEDGERIAKMLNESDLEFYANQIFSKWLDNGAEAKKKWVLTFSSIYGGNEIIPRIREKIDEWAKSLRGVIVGEAIKALALNKSKMALLIVDNISRKYKYNQVKNSAKEALEFVAEQRGISKEELSDKIVPTLGFDKDGERIFDYGTRKFKAIISPNLDIEIYDESEKKLKTLPVPNKKDDESVARESYLEFKNIKKEIKTTVRMQASRLELALSTERRWRKEGWMELFVNNPIMHHFAMGLIWGSYKNGELEETFRYMEDGTFNTKDEDEFEIQEDCKIGLIHPVEISKEDIELWKKQLSDYDIVQPINQLEREFYKILEKEKNKNSCERFKGTSVRKYILLKLVGRKYGWLKGETLGGHNNELIKEDISSNINAILYSENLIENTEFESMEIILYELKFYDRRTERDKSLNLPKECFLNLNDIPKKFFSETLKDISEISTISKELSNIREKSVNGEV